MTTIRYAPPRGTEQRFRARVAKSKLRKGVNKLEVFAIKPGGVERRLVRLAAYRTRG